MTESELWEWMMKGNYPNGGFQFFEHRTATAVLKRDIKFNDGTMCPAGTKVKIIMASRFGDVGLTDDLTVENGYKYRTQAIHGGPVGHENPPADLLEQIYPFGT